MYVEYLWEKLSEEFYMANRRILGRM